jgi:hypothetical protein
MFAPGKRPNHQRVGLIVAAVLGGLVVLCAVVLFVFGEDLFGSDPGTIDAYNRKVLNTCEVPAGSTLVRTYVRRHVDNSGRRLRSMSYVYASPLAGDEVAAFYGLTGPGVGMFVPPDRACKFGNRPEVLVLSRWTPAHPTALNPATETAGLPADPSDRFWSGPDAEVTDIADVPPNTGSFLRLRLAQDETHGVFG